MNLKLRRHICVVQLMGLVTLEMRPGHLILMNLWNVDIENKHVNFIQPPHLRVLDEISEVLDERQSVTVEDLEKLNYLEQVSLLPCAA